MDWEKSTSLNILGKSPLWRLKRLEDNIKIDHRETDCDDLRLMSNGRLWTFGLCYNSFRHGLSYVQRCLLTYVTKEVADVSTRFPDRSIRSCCKTYLNVTDHCLINKTETLKEHTESSHTPPLLCETPFAFKSRTISKEDGPVSSAWAARFCVTLVNQIKLNDFVPFDMITFVSPLSLSLSPALLFTNSKRRRNTLLFRLPPSQEMFSTLFSYAFNFRN
jgi:hypothetical protein